MRQAVVAEPRPRTADKSLCVRELVAEVRAALVVLPPIDGLDMYRRMGHFYYLDQLGDAPKSWASPDSAWQKTETAALTDSAVAVLYREVTLDRGDNEAWGRFITATKERIAIDLERVWDMIAV